MMESEDKIIMTMTTRIITATKIKKERNYLKRIDSLIVFMGLK